MSRTPSRPVLAPAAASLLFALTVAGAAAADAGDDSALAEALFVRARALIAEGNYAEACPKLAESQRLEPKLGTLLNLALCHEKEGKVASAWAAYRQAAELAARAHQDERARVARESAAKLDALLPHVTLTIPAGSPLTVTLDGRAIRPAALETPIPVDPGAHEIVASAPGRRSFTMTVTAVAGASQVVAIPPLDPAPGVAPALAAAPDALPAPAPPPDVAPEPRPGRPVLGYALLGAGGAAIVTGAVFGVVAFADKSAANRECGPMYCPPSGLDDISVQKASEAVSTVAIGVGALAVAAGVYLVVRNGHRADARPAAAVGVGPIGLGRGAGPTVTVRF